jgi:NADH-quinone oxidoreductase subunit N
MPFLHLFENQFSTVLPEIFLLGSLSLLLLYGVTLSTSLPANLPVMTRPLTWLALLTLGLTLLLTLGTPAKALTLFSGVLVHDAFTRYAKAFLLLGGMATLLASVGTFRSQALQTWEYLILVLIALLGMGLMVSANDLIALYLALEMQSLSLYVLAAFQKDSAFSTEGGLKYFVLGALSSGLLLFGSSLLYGFTGTTSLEEMALLTTGGDLGPGVEVGFLFLGAGLLFKLAAVPFHMWAPDVYEGAPTYSATFFAVVPKLAVFALLLKIFVYALYDLLEAWQPLFLGASFGSMVVGAFGALQQRKIKRLLAYSSIGHVGYMLLGLATGTLEGVQGLLLYLILYMVMSLNLWTLVLGMETGPGQPGLRNLTDLGGLGRSHPLLGITLALTLFSMAGMPPLAGFCAKVYVFFSAIEGGLYLLAVVGVLSSCVGAFYYMRLIKIVFFEKVGHWTLFTPLDREKALLLGGTTLFILFFFAYPSPLLVLSHKMALSLAW